MSTFDDYLTVSEAARIAGVTPSRIRQLLRENQIAGRKFGQYQWMVFASEARRIANADHEGRRGRPRGSNKN